MTISLTLIFWGKYLNFILDLKYLFRAREWERINLGLYRVCMFVRMPQALYTHVLRYLYVLDALPAAWPYDKVDVEDN